MAAPLMAGLLPLHCPQCSMAVAFTPSHALRCACGAISLSHEQMEALATQPGHELLDEIRLQFNKALEASIVPTMKALVKMYGEVLLPEPEPTPEPSHLAWQTSYAMAQPTKYKGPTTISKDKVDLDKLPPALKEFFQDFVSATP